MFAKSTMVTCSDTPLEPGAHVGEYVVEAPIAEGGFGAVYRVVHPVIGKSAAVKVLKREFSTNPEMVSRFLDEARAVNQIRHNNIIDIFAFGVLDDGRHYFVMELLEGTTLEELLRTRGALPVEEALAILRQLGRALEAAHEAGITHRDLKPENVLIAYDEEGTPTPKLVDFGIAKLRRDNAPLHKTRSGTPMGTPLYMSPEQVYGRETDHRTDIYALGVLVFEVLCGVPPFDGTSVMEVLTKHATATPPAMSAVRHELPPELDAPVLHMLEKDPARRPQSVAAALVELFDAARSAGAALTTSARDELASAATLAGGVKSLAPSPHRKTFFFTASALALLSSAGLVATMRAATPKGSPVASPVESRGAIASSAPLPPAAPASVASSSPIVVVAVPSSVHVPFEPGPAATSAKPVRPRTPTVARRPRPPHDLEF